MDLNDVTIIVPTRNERNNIAAFLQSIPLTLRLIIVDASDDDTRAIIRRTRPQRTVIVDEPGNIAWARQKGADLAESEWLLFSDADMIFAADYFTQLERIVPQPHLGGIVGAKQSRDRYRRYYRLFSQSLGLLCRLGVPAATGSNMLVRRAALYAAGGFDLSLSCNEDSLLMWNIRRSGYRVAYAGALKVYETDHRRLDRGVLRKTTHSLSRCAMLFSGLLPRQLREDDWGYWNKPNSA